MSQTINIAFAEAHSLIRTLSFDKQTLPCSISFNQIDHLTQSEFESDVENQQIIILNDLCITPQVLSNNPKLQLVALCSTGYDKQPIQLLQSKGIHLCNVREYASHSLAEHAFMLMINLIRNFSGYDEAVKSGKWSKCDNFCYLETPIYELYQKTLVIIGSGTSGKALANKAKAFGINVIFSERKNAIHCREGYVPFLQAIQLADIISLHCELNGDTYHLIDEETLLMLQKHALLINIARGGLVDENAVIHALLTGDLGGYAADVLTQEPPAINHPMITTRLPNLLITPHVAWASQEAQHRLVIEIEENICAYLQGCPKNLVC